MSEVDNIMRTVAPDGPGTLVLESVTVPFAWTRKDLCVSKKAFSFGICGGRLTALPRSAKEAGPRSLMYCFNAEAYAFTTAAWPDPSAETAKQ